MILTSCNTLILIIINILLFIAIKLEFCKKICRFVVYVFLTFIFELLFNILMSIFLPKESYYKKDKLNYINELEK